MKRLILLALWMTVLSLSGCGESDRKRAADRVAEQADLARRYYAQAAGLMTDRPMVERPGTETEPKAVEVAPINTRALAVLEKAESVANAALSSNPAATPIGRIPAHRILTEIRRQKGLYHARAAGVHAALTGRLCQQGLLMAHGLTDLANQAEFYRLLGAMSPEKVRAMLQTARQEQQAAQADDEALADRREDLEARVAKAQQEAVPLNDQARELRVQARQTPGLAALKVLSAAERIERQADVHAAVVNELRVQLEQVADQAALSAVRLQGLENQVKVLTVCMEDFAVRARTVAHRRKDLGERTADAADALRALMTELAGAFSAAVAEYNNALTALDAAKRSNQAGRQGVDQMIRQAGQANAGKPRRAAGGPTLLESMADGRSRRLPFIANEGELALAAGDARRQMLELFGRVQALQNRLNEAADAAQVSLGDAVSLSLQAVSEVPQQVDRTKSDYLAVCDTFQDAPNKLVPADLKPSAWIYQLHRAQAFLGLYLLSRQQGQPDGQYLASALTEIGEIRKERPQLTVEMAGVDEMDRLLRQMQ